MVKCPGLKLRPCAIKHKLLHKWHLDGVELVSCWAGEPEGRFPSCFESLLKALSVLLTSEGRSGEGGSSSNNSNKLTAAHYAMENCSAALLQWQPPKCVARATPIPEPDTDTQQQGGVGRCERQGRETNLIAECSRCRVQNHVNSNFPLLTAPKCQQIEERAQSEIAREIWIEREGEGDSSGQLVSGQP